MCPPSSCLVDRFGASSGWFQALLAQVQLHEDPLGDQVFDPGDFKYSELLEGEQLKDILAHRWLRSDPANHHRDCSQ